MSESELRKQLRQLGKQKSIDAYQDRFLKFSEKMVDAVQGGKLSPSSSLLEGVNSTLKNAHEAAIKTRHSKTRRIKGVLDRTTQLLKKKRSSTTTTTTTGTSTLKKKKKCGVWWWWLVLILLLLLLLIGGIVLAVRSNKEEEE